MILGSVIACEVVFCFEKMRVNFCGVHKNKNGKVRDIKTFFELSDT
jgi:hypothetical protein